MRFFPDALPSPVSANLAALRIKHLLTMSAGSEREPTFEMVKHEDWVRHFLSVPIAHSPGSVFMYNSGATYLCSAIVQKVTGQRLLDYLRPRLFEPLGIEGATWETCPRGIDVGGWGLSVPTGALAKFGQLYLQQGLWRGRRLLPAAWVAEATSRRIQQPLPAQPARPNERNDWVQGYGYQFWRSTHGAYRGDGAFGQFTIVLPEADAVVAINSETGDMQGELDLVWEHLLPAMHVGSLPPDDDAQAQLRRTLGALALATPTGQANSPTAAAVSGHAYRLAPNALGLVSAAFAFDGDSCRLVLGSERADHPLCGGIGRWQEGWTALPGTPPRLVSGGAPPPGTPSRVAAAGAWKTDDTFEMVLRYIETPHHDRLTCRFSGDTVTVAFMNSMSAMSPQPKDWRPPVQGRRA